MGMTEKSKRFDPDDWRGLSDHVRQELDQQQRERADRLTATILETISRGRYQIDRRGYLVVWCWRLRWSDRALREWVENRLRECNFLVRDSARHTFGGTTLHLQPLLSDRLR